MGALVAGGWPDFLPTFDGDQLAIGRADAVGQLVGAFA